MKKYLVVLAAMAFVMVMVSGAYADTVAPTVGVSATVLSKCTSLADGVLAFEIDPSVPSSTITTNTQPSVQCTNSKTVAVKVKSTNNTTEAAGGTFASTLTSATCSAINYSYTWATAPVGQGFGAGKDIALVQSGSITSSAAAVEFCSDYADTITMTVEF